ncbi:hypothetical protein Scep_031077 [Stephania cephalantha]|uniref:Uncharacterized protein n=1 Tax=Stephania cephalantha TaxID=152367 RepID=A0AAP0HDZ6_9MAGN
MSEARDTPPAQASKLCDCDWQGKPLGTSKVDMYMPPQASKLSDCEFIYIFYVPPICACEHALRTTHMGIVLSPPNVDTYLEKSRTSKCRSRLDLRTRHPTPKSLHRDVAISTKSRIRPATTRHRAPWPRRRRARAAARAARPAAPALPPAASTTTRDRWPPSHLVSVASPCSRAPSLPIRTFLSRRRSLSRAPLSASPLRPPTR